MDQISSKNIESQDFEESNFEAVNVKSISCLGRVDQTREKKVANMTFNYRC